MKRRAATYWQQTSSALVITLLGIVLVTIIIVGFMQVISLSLTTAKSYADIERATLAAQAGLDTAIAQITLAAGTNMAFVTGETNFPSTNTPLTVIGAGNLTNLDQMMPLVSGPIDYLTNFGESGFSNNFNNYASSLVGGNAAQTVDVNTPYQFIQQTTDTNAYRATWVTMTNMVGNQPNYTRFAYVVLDDSARVNPALMTGSGMGFTNSTNWYAGPQDISLTNSSAQLLTPSQITQVVNATNAFAYSDATLGETFANRTDYEAVKQYFTAGTNASFDIIPAWMKNGGQPKYNINDLATNVAYGATPMARASNIASIIENNLPKFYQRDPALKGTNTTLYVGRLAANIVTYISPDGTWPASEYTTNTSGIAPQVKGVFPILITEQVYAPTGGYQTASHKSATVASRFWLSCWNPYTTPVSVTNAVLHVWHRPTYALGTGAPITATTNYVQTVNYISEPSGIAKPNEFITLGFPAVTNILTSPTATTGGPVAQVDAVYNGGDAAPYEQYSLTVNGQTVAQTANQPSLCGLQHDSGDNMAPPPTNNMDTSAYGTDGSVVADPRFQNYQYSAWECTHDEYLTVECNNGYSANGGGSAWKIFPSPAGNNTWTNRDNIARAPKTPGNYPTVGPPFSQTPDQLTNPPPYNQSTDSNAAPEVIRNGPMVSIGELGHIFDPAYANDKLTAVPPAADNGGYLGPYENGGARSLRIGRPEANGAVTSSGSPTTYSWDVDGERAIDLLDLFTVNNANTSGAGKTNTIAQDLTNGGVMGRINPNTASSNVLAAVFSGIQLTSDPGMTNASGGSMGPITLTNLDSLASNVIANRPYSSLSDLYKVMPMFDANINYSPKIAVNTSGYLNVFNRVHQEAFGKWIQHLNVQSRSFRIYVIGQMLDSSQKPHGSVAMQVGVFLQYNPQEARYNPIIQYVHMLK